MIRFVETELSDGLCCVGKYVLTCKGAPFPRELPYTGRVYKVTGQLGRQRLAVTNKDGKGVDKQFILAKTVMVICSTREELDKVEAVVREMHSRIAGTITDTKDELRALCAANARVRNRV